MPPDALPVCRFASFKKVPAKQSPVPLGRGRGGSASRDSLQMVILQGVE